MFYHSLHKYSSIIISLISLIFLNSCSTTPSTQKSPQPLRLDSNSLTTEQNDTSWIHSNGEDSPWCSKLADLCAVGSGPSLAIASSKARGEIAKIFKTHITDSTQIKSSTMQLQTDMGKAPTGSKWEALEKNLTEQGELVLEGVNIAQSTEHKGIFYALAVLNKSQAKDRFIQQMNQLDALMDKYHAQENYLSYLHFKRLFAKRSEINSLYQIVAGGFYKEKWTQKHVSQKENCCGSPTKIKVIYTTPMEEDFRAFFTDTLTTLGLNVDKVGDFTIKVEWSVKNLYLKVKGFEKYECTLSLIALSPNGTKIQAASFSSVQTARDLNAAIEMAYNDIKPQLIPKLETWEFKH